MGGGGSGEGGAKVGFGVLVKGGEGDSKQRG